MEKETCAKPLEPESVRGGNLPIVLMETSVCNGDELRERNIHRGGGYRQQSVQEQEPEGTSFRS